jgi:hypothetical protein
LGANALYHATSASVRSYLSVRVKRALRARRAARELAAAKKAAVLPSKPIRELPPLLPPRALHQHHGVEDAPSPDGGATGGSSNGSEPPSPSSTRGSVLTLDPSLPVFGGGPALSPVPETPTHGDPTIDTDTVPSTPPPLTNSPSVIVHRDMIFTEPLSEAQQLAVAAATAGGTNFASSSSSLPRPSLTANTKLQMASPSPMSPNGNGTVNGSSRHKRLATVVNTGSPLPRKQITQRRYSIVVERNREKQRIREEQGNNNIHSDVIHMTFAFKDILTHLFG